MEKNFSYREVMICQADNGVIVREKNNNCFGSREFVFNDMKDLKAFIGRNFLDDEAIKKLEAAKNAKPHKEK